MRLALLYGGRSGEHEVSCRSAASILKNLDHSRYTVVLIAVDHQGRWYLQQSAAPDESGALPVDTSGPRVDIVPADGVACRGRSLDIDVVFPIIHGWFGEDGTLQGLLELAGIPYVGSGVLASAAGMDKEVMKRIWREDGLPVARFATFGAEHYGSSKDGKLHTEAVKPVLDGAGLSVERGLFVKPARGGSSVGISRVSSMEELLNALSTAFRYDNSAIVEESIVGREIECAVVGNERIETFPPGEIVPREGFYDYDAKYVDADAARLIVPADMSNELSEQVRALAVDAYRSLGAQGYARVDLFVTKGNRLCLNEINTIPGFTTISMFPRMCEAGGLAYRALIDRLVDLGISRFQKRAKLEFRYFRR